MKVLLFDASDRPLGRLVGYGSELTRLDEDWTPLEVTDAISRTVLPVVDEDETEPDE